mmetsp:Transcript_152668/g.284379  ORF Transcript_152668/g.284379 Transcript_152668/m.284379 type:complete len:769 (-) Transcript_152668:41-2347(-)
MFGQPRHSLMSTLARAITIASVWSASSADVSDCSSPIPAEMPDVPQTAEKGDLYLLQTSLDMNRQNKSDQAEGVGLELRDAKSPASKQTTAAPEDAATATGVTKNEEGDLAIFIAGVFSNGITMVICVIFFLVARSFYPDVYEWQLIKGLSPNAEVSKTGWLNWAYRSCKVDLDDVQNTAGLDQAMLLAFSLLGMKIMAIIGIPMICIMGPMNWVFGGHAAGEDRLSYLSFGNVVDDSWLYWVHCFVVWGVVFCVQVCVFEAMEDFQKRRVRWLTELPEIQANTVMVEGIPEEMQSDELLKAHFEKIWGTRKVKSATVVKICPELSAMCRQRAILKLAIERSAKEESEGKTPKRSVQEIASEISAITEEIRVERKKVLSEAVTPGKVSSDTGFVTFFERYDAEITASSQYSHDVTQWVVSQPPPPQAIVWENLEQGEAGKEVKILIGYALVACLYMCYLPLVIRISQIANEINLGPLQPVWGAIAPTLGLQIMVAFLPTFLRLIFHQCFPLPSTAEEQAMLQNWYFVFQVVFVILVTAIGPSLWDVMVAIATQPFSVFEILGDTMPDATHFYMNFLVLQWAAHFSNLTRSVQLFKYLFFVRLYEPAQAKDMAEPEDQDYYGIGSRSARFTINLCIGIIYGTLSPGINLLTFINFAICRLVYGYLVNFAENKKPDLGGRFWVHQLLHVFIGNIIYCIMMTGVLLGRSNSSGPGIIAAGSLFYVLWSFNRFRGLFSWERLTIHEVVVGKRNPKVLSAAESTYVQPQFNDH